MYFNGDDRPYPTPFAVICDCSDSPIPLTEEQYDVQLNRPDNLWTCPKCGESCSWDDKCPTTYPKETVDPSATSIPQEILDSFFLLATAFESGNACLTNATRKLDGSTAYVICIATPNGERTKLTPFALFFNSEMSSQYIPGT